MIVEEGNDLHRIGSDILKKRWIIDSVTNPLPASVTLVSTFILLAANRLVGVVARECLSTISRDVLPFWASIAPLRISTLMGGTLVKASSASVQHLAMFTITWL